MGSLSVRPGVLPGNPTIYSAVKIVVANELNFDVEVISWLRPGAIVAGTDDPSRHATGDALDLRPAGAQLVEGSPCGGGVLDGTSMGRGDQLAAALTAAGFGVVLWRTCTGGNHYDHVHTDSPPGKIPVTPSGGSQGASGGAVGALGRLLDAETWIRAGEVVAGVSLIGLSIVIVAREGI